MVVFGLGSLHVVKSCFSCDAGLGAGLLRPPEGLVVKYGSVQKLGLGQLHAAWMMQNQERFGMSQRRKLTIMVLEERQTRTLQVDAAWLYGIKPLLGGLLTLCVVLMAGLVYTATLWQQGRHEVQRLAQSEAAAQQEVAALREAKSAEISEKMQQLAQSEAALNVLADYLRERGVRVRPPEARAVPPNGQPVPNAGGPEYRLPAADSPEFALSANEVLAAARKVPLGRPSMGALTSPFGPRPNPFTGKGYEFHHGIDLRGPVGEPVRATADGTVVFAGRQDGYGLVVKLRHGFGFATVYGHLSAIEVQDGARVQVGDTIGLLGSTGRSTGPHLHYEVRQNDMALDPERFLQLNGLMQASKE